MHPIIAALDAALGTSPRAPAPPTPRPAAQPAQNPVRRAPVPAPIAPPPAAVTPREATLLASAQSVGLGSTPATRAHWTKLMRQPGGEAAVRQMVERFRITAPPARVTPAGGREQRDEHDVAEAQQHIARLRHRTLEEHTAAIVADSSLGVDFDEDGDAPSAGAVEAPGLSDNQARMMAAMRASREGDDEGFDRAMSGDLAQVHASLGSRPLSVDVEPERFTAAALTTAHRTSRRRAT